MGRDIAMVMFSPLRLAFVVATVLAIASVNSVEAEGNSAGAESALELPLREMKMVSDSESPPEPFSVDSSDTESDVAGPLGEGAEVQEVPPPAAADQKEQARRRRWYARRRTTPGKDGAGAPEGATSVGSESRRRGFSAIPGKKFRWAEEMELLGGPGASTSFVGYGETKDWYIRSGSEDGKVRIQDAGGEIYLLGGTYRTSYIGHGPTRNWYIRSGKPEGRVAIQDGGGDIWFLGGAGITPSHAGVGPTKDWMIRSGKNNGKVVIQDKGGEIQLLGGPGLRPSEIR